MNKKLAIVHTTPLTVEPLKALAKDYIPDYQIVNFVDDSILPQLNENGGNTEEVEERLIQYMRYAEQAGADVILNACSSVGEVAAKAREQINTPVVRIDEPMAELAIEKGEKIGVAATLATTLNPTIALLRSKSYELNKQVEFQSRIAGEAYQCLLAGDKDGHDEKLKAVLSDLASESDVVVLAQASMARVVTSLPEEMQDKFLSSPALGMQRVKETIEGAKS
ncbi:aspartate/glutamate racemase family protein [Sediminibacillus massiliensis]|uniref:aspartate/glutamate racemase family protein n=1 Tax=Sediminibacillus massiliensis TaxID=1926277 RepID=UPI0015C3A352|nr:aspartate/glutamate racemase family protein [Sediminibacillus massiliensis]